MAAMTAQVPERELDDLWDDGEFVLSRVRRSSDHPPALFVQPASAHPTAATIARLAHAHSLRDDLDNSWAARPTDLIGSRERLTLRLEDPGGEVLATLLDKPWAVAPFLRVAVGVARALSDLHGRGLVHKDVKPSNVLVDVATSKAWLTGFGIASRLRRERQSPERPEIIAGTFAYMAPEQTGRMNRSIDSRSDLYAFGVMLYQMLVGALPFMASDPMELVHCHVARRPVPAHERSAHVPKAVSAVVMKLLAKVAEERYQTAAGVESDLRRCLEDLDRKGSIHDFPLGEHDIPDRLVIPEKLYGREREIDTLLASFDRIASGGAPELVLVSGYSGIGKSSVVNELHPVLVPPRGLFASGKFDQYKRDIPYSTLAQAFQSLIRQLLTKSEAELGRWRHDLRNALDQNGQLIVDLVPELKLVIGDQPTVPVIPTQDAQRRFQLVFGRFIGVFARQEHPLALFLDDLQWLDAATLDLLEDLLTRSELQHLMLIGAYRNNEVDAAHPLMRKLEAIRSAGGRVEEMTLGPLTQEHLGQLLADALRSELERSAPLAHLVHEKTGGNPFFAIQFISSLADEDMLAFDHDAACWSWNLDRIHAKGSTDNVVDLMIIKLVRLPAQTQTALQQLACLGGHAEVTTLSLVLEMSQEQVHAVLWDSVCQGLVEQLDGSFKFIHDRVQEAAYSLIPEASRAAAHVRIGRLLLARTSPQEREATIFAIVNHLNRGAALISSCYASWGADGKVRQLGRLYPDLKQEQPLPGPSSTVMAPVEGLDLATVIRVSQAVSGEIALEKLVETLLRTAIEHAGAERGLFVLPQGGELWIRAEATTSGSSVNVSLCERPVSAAALPESVVRYVARTQESVILDDASGRNPFSSDEYITAQRARSVLCVPLVRQAALVALLYLENNLAPSVFSPARIAVLNVLASEATMSLDNSRLYRELEERGAKIRQDELELRRIIDAIPQAIVILGPDGSTLGANAFMLDLTGLTLDDIQADVSRVRRFHPDDVERLQDGRRRALERGEPFEAEFRIRRKDGQYRWFLVRYNPFRDANGHVTRWYATGTDIEDRKQAEERVQNENLALREELDRSSMFEEIVGSSQPLRAVLSHVSKVAPTDSTVLITGETGTGKELIARAIHKRSARSARAFISVNCAAIPASLIASELFGHEKGAFTGALQRRQGRFELADGGTLFLDEVGELPAETQIMLLRVLQEREFERVGGSRPIRVNVRLIAATNRDLEAAVAAGTVRADLFYRLNVFPLEVPPLRERRPDIPLLVEYFIHRFAYRAGKRVRGLSKETSHLLQSYDWPGNIRELQNVVERAVIIADSDTLAIDERWLGGRQAAASPVVSPPATTLATRERQAVEAALRESKGRVSGPFGAAARLGVPSSTLESKIRALKIDKRQFRST
jgi:PAS domain S-box-containing protein